SQSFGEGSSLQITSHKLNGKNFLQWSSVFLVIRGRGKIRYITSKIQQPDVNDPTYENWELNNSIVIAWLINLMDMDITEYYNELQMLWQELDLHYEADWEGLDGNQKFRKHLEKERLYEFLAGLNHELDEVRRRILG
ncbi:LOW QUALITY PROTEIN: UBN2_3 domain-containing protein, partial [Cephalotus follicularis]